MRVWVLANDKEEKCTTLKEYFMSKPQVKPFIFEQKNFHARNKVKVKIIAFKRG